MDKNFEQLFSNPPAKYRGAPFWAWNCKLDKQTMMDQVDYFKEMGLGGFHMHCRTGLDTEYMSEEFMEVIKGCVQKAKENEMLAWLYDEDRWPSGAGGGFVTKDERYKSRYLVFTPTNQDEKAKGEQLLISGMATVSNGSGKLLARYDVTLENGCLKSYKLLKDGESGENVWYAYLEISLPSPWYNNETYVDTLNKKAIERFIETTHEKYFEAVGDEFGKTIPAIFTDEPQFARKTTLGFAEGKKDIIIPYTDDFPESYFAEYNQSFFETLPELFWELPNNAVSLARYRYHDHVAERFSSAFSDTIGDWCKAHGIKLTGHMMEEPSLESQTCALGEAMRSYRSFQLPGIDMLCDRREYSTAKQAQSAVHQFGYSGMISELYGVTNWDFDFRGHKLQGDWQAALGVTTRVHHLSWASMEGEAKRDYPASIFYQSPWYKEYPLIENHFARVNTALTSGKPYVRVGVIHPVESYWLSFGSDEQTGAVRELLERQFNDVIDWLLFGLIDFDFICESLLKNQYSFKNNSLFNVGVMAYDAVVVPSCKTLRRSTLDALKEFAAAGGKVIFMGDKPTHIDAVLSDEGEKLASKCNSIEFNQETLLNELSDIRYLDIRDERGRRTNDYLTQMRLDENGSGKWLFIAYGRDSKTIDVPKKSVLKITLNEKCSVEKFDTMTGEHSPIPFHFEGGKTVLSVVLYEHDSLLLRIEASKGEICETISSCSHCKNKESFSHTLSGKHKITLSEPNVLLLDQADFCLDNGAFCGHDEVLKIDNILREHLSYPLKMEALAQPWTEKKDDVTAQKHSLKLTYKIFSDIDISGAKLALERPQDCEILFNGASVSSIASIAADGWFVDRCIETVSLPNIPKGDSELVITLPFSRRTNLEWMYLLGDFGVELCGNTAKIIEPVRELAFGDWTYQGLPFYAGNVTYNCLLDLENGDYSLEATKYRAPLLKVEWGKNSVGHIVFSPYKLNLGELEGKTRLDITAYGSRVNAFGPVHNCDENVRWFGPQAWRSIGASFSYEYQLKRCGMLSAPTLTKI